MNYLHVDKTSTVPIYKQLKIAIQSAIFNGALTNRSELPTEDEVCTLFNIHRQVVRKAYAELISEGYLRRKKGGSPYVFRALTLDVPLMSLPFISDLVELPIKLDRRILVFERVKKLERKHEPIFDEMFRIVLVFMYNRVPVYKQDIYLRFDAFENLQTHHFYTTQFKQLIELDHGFTISMINNFAYQSNLSKIEASVLDLNCGMPSMRVESQVFDTENNKIAVIESTFPGEYFHFVHEVYHEK